MDQALLPAGSSNIEYATQAGQYCDYALHYLALSLILDSEQKQGLAPQFEW